MRSPVKSRCVTVAVLFLASGCSTDEPAVLAAPELKTRVPTTISPAEPEPDPLRERALVVIGGRGAPFSSGSGGRETDDIGDVTTPIMTRLVYQCSDDVTFAVRTAGDRIEVYPPGFTLGYIVLNRQPADSGVRYTREHAEFRV